MHRTVSNRPFTTIVASATCTLAAVWGVAVAQLEPASRTRADVNAETRAAEKAHEIPLGGASSPRRQP